MGPLPPLILAVPRCRRPAAVSLLTFAFVVSLAAAAPHSVHHLGQDLERQPIACAAALAWGAAFGADCPPPIQALEPPAATSRLSLEPLIQPRTVPAGIRLGRAPPPARPR